MPEIREIADLGDDRLRVTVMLDDGTEVSGEGWLSAVTNHYDPDAYGDDGHLQADAQPRRMTPEETVAYLLTLAVPAPEPTVYSAVADLLGSPS